MGINSGFKGLKHKDQRSHHFLYDQNSPLFKIHTLRDIMPCRLAYGIAAYSFRVQCSPEKVFQKRSDSSNTWAVHFLEMLVCMYKSHSASYPRRR